MGGNFGIGDATPLALLTVGSGDLFQVDASGNTTLQNQADLRFGDADGSNYVAFQSGAVVGSNVTWTLPTADATGVWKSNGSGTLSIGAVSLTTDVSGILPMANGGTNKNMTASNGAIAYSDADSLELSAIGTSGQALISGGAGAPTWFAPTAGSVLFAGTGGILQQDNSGFFYDGTNHRLGIGDTTPDAPLTILSSAATNTYLTITNTNAGNYNPGIQFDLAKSTPLYTMGIDESDSSKFKIFAGSDITGSEQLTLDSTGTVSIANLNLGAMSFDADAGIVSWMDMPVTSASPAGTPMSYWAQIDSNAILSIYAESDGAGSIQNSGVSIGNDQRQVKLRSLEPGPHRGKV
jgi:hypothetical protein